jgi:hypothetical protein
LSYRKPFRTDAYAFLNLVVVVLHWVSLVVCIRSVVGLRRVSAHVAKAVGLACGGARLLEECRAWKLLLVGRLLVVVARMVLVRSRAGRGSQCSISFLFCAYRHSLIPVDRLFWPHHGAFSSRHFLKSASWKAAVLKSTFTPTSSPQVMFLRAL